LLVDPAVPRQLDEKIAAFQNKEKKETHQSVKKKVHAGRRRNSHNTRMKSMRMEPTRLESELCFLNRAERN